MHPPGERRPGAESATAAYRSTMARRVLARAPVACAILAACAGLATVFEVLRFPERRAWMLGADAYFLAVIAGTLYLTRRRPDDAVVILVVASNLVGVALNVYHAAVGASVALCMWTLTALLATTAVVLPWGWRHQALSSLGAVLFYPLMLATGGADALSWAAGGTYLAWVVALAVAAAGLIDQYLRADFRLTARLSEREARLQSYFDLALVGTAIVSPQRGWIEVNGEFCSILGHRRERLLATTWPEFVHPDDRDAETVLFANALGGEAARASGELRLTRADGEVVHALVSMRGLPGPSHAIDHVMILVQDVTERSRREAALRRAKEVAEAGQRTKSAFLALVSHELRTPMTIISGMTDIVLGGDLAPDQRRCLQKTKEATSNVVTFVNDVLELSRLEAGKLPLRPRSIELRPWLAEQLQPLAWLAERRELTFAWAVHDPVVPYMVTDPDRLRQILVNLVDNAVKFTERGGVTVTVDAAGDGMLRFTVADTGCGIPEDRQDAIFDAFTQLEAPARRRIRGSGLGLSICRRLAELLGGSIAVESREGQGSRFHLTLPVVLVTDEARPKAAGAA